MSLGSTSKSDIKREFILWNYLILSFFYRCFYIWWGLAVLGKNNIFNFIIGFRYLVILGHAIMLFYHFPLVPTLFFLALLTSPTHYSLYSPYFPIPSLSSSYITLALLHISKTHQSITDELIIVFLTSLWLIHINFVTSIFLLLVVCWAFMILIAGLGDLEFELIIEF